MSNTQAALDNHKRVTYDQQNSHPSGIVGFQAYRSQDRMDSKPRISNPEQRFDAK